MRQPTKGIIPYGISLPVVYAITEIFTGLEMRHVFASQRHRFARFRVAALAGRPEMQRETAKPTDFDALAVGEGVTHDIEQLLDRQLHILRRKVLLLGSHQFD